MPFFNPEAPHSYLPGLFEQDLFTLPLEAGLIGIMNSYYSPGAPLWPFQNEKSDGPKNPTRHSKAFLATGGSVIAVPLISALTFSSKEFPLGIVARGWVHAHLVTEMAISFSKVTFQRHRPFYDTAAKNGPPTADSHFSFLSGHSAHSFAFAAFSSSLLFKYSSNSIVPLVYAGGIFATAAWIGSTRAIDGQHHWSDVIPSALVGTLLSRMVYNQMESVAENTWKYYPEITPTGSGKKFEFSLKLNARRDF